MLDDSSGALEPPRPSADAVLTSIPGGAGVAPRPVARPSGAGEAALLLLRELLVGQHALVVQFAQLLELREHRL